MKRVRLVAAGVLVRVMQGRSLNEVLPAALVQVSELDRAFLQALCFLGLRQFHRLDFILSQLLQKPIKDTEIHALALLGLTQLSYMAVKPHAAVTETVAAAGHKRWAKPLLNALLRNFLRRRESLELAADRDFEASVSHPAWLRRRIERAWPQQAEAIFRENNRQAPMTLRVNLNRCGRDNMLNHLASSGLSAHPLEEVPSAIVLDTPVAVKDLPGFMQGRVSVQDGAAQLAAPLLDVQQGMRVLDVCAAPGGKTMHILETCPRLDELVALDSSQDRLASAEENLARIGSCPVRLMCADARCREDWWDGRRFDRILVDAPCSATGVIRRHPDIKLLRRNQDIHALAQMQYEILETVWPLLAEGGVLVYATCSVLPEENELQILTFVNAHPDARPAPIYASWGTPTRIGRQILPGKMDGFYYAKMEKCGT